MNTERIKELEKYVQTFKNMVELTQKLPTQMNDGRGSWTYILKLVLNKSLWDDVGKIRKVKNVLTVSYAFIL